MDQITKENVDHIIQRYRFETIKTLIDKPKEFWDTIVGLKISVADSKKKTKNFHCVYKHYTEQFSESDYSNDDIDEKNNSTSKTSLIQFGYLNDEFYITGQTAIRVYSKRETPHLPIPYNVKYEARLDDYEQSELLNDYAENRNIPEWFAITFFKMLGNEIIGINGLIDKLYFE